MTQNTVSIAKASVPTNHAPIRRFSIGRLPLSGRPVVIPIAKPV